MGSVQCRFCFAGHSYIEEEVKKLPNISPQQQWYVVVVVVAAAAAAAAGAGVVRT